MTTLAEGKLASENFLNDAAANIEQIESLRDLKVESEKLILDEIATKNNTDESESHIELVENYIPETDNKLEKSDAVYIDNSHSTEKNSSIEEVPETDINKELINDDVIKSPDEGVDLALADKEEQWDDLLGSGVILKKILQQGETDTKPKRSDQCLIKYTCQLENSDVIIEQADNFRMCLGEADVVQGLDVAVGLMNKHERCLLKIQSRLAFGDKGLPPHIPSKATVVYDVELLDFKEEEDFDAMSVKERCIVGNKKRERGNWWYQRGENTLAVQCYRRALDFLDEVETERDSYKPTDSELQELLEDRLKVLNNMASAQIKMELYDQALTSLQTVLRCQPENVKALYRKAKVHISKNDLSQALQLLEKAKSIEPGDSTIAREIQNVNGLIERQRNSEREYARRMFGGGSAPTTKESSQKSPNSSSKFQVWTSLGATLVLGLAGLLAYKLKYA